MRAAFATAADTPALARLHAAAFPNAWSEADFATLLASPGVVALLADEGLALIRTVADEAELLTIAVRPGARGQGIGRSLLGAALEVAGLGGAAAMHLEVAADNAPALALYQRAGFETVGRRRGYYARIEGPAQDAVLMRRALNTPR